MATFKGGEIMSKLSTLKKKWIKDPKIKEAYNLLAPEFKIAQTLIKARLKVRMTQTEVASAMGTTQSVVARLETGEQLPSLKTLLRYAHALGKDIQVTVT